MKLILYVIMFLGVLVSVNALNMSSTNYGVEAFMGAGVSNMSSTNYFTEGLISSMFVGNISSTNYGCEAGYYYIEEVQPAIAAPAVGQVFNISWEVWNGTSWENASDYWLIPSCPVHEINCTEIVVENMNTSNYAVIIENSTQPIFKITNDRTADMVNLTMRINATCADYIIRASDIWNTSTINNLTTTYNQIMYNATTIKQTQTLYAWLFFDTHYPINQCQDWPDIFINATWS